MREDTLSVRLRQVRGLVGLSARELDRLAGLAEGHCSLIENGTRPHVEVRTAQSLARVLGVSLDWLIDGSGRTPSERAVRAAVESARTAKSPAA